MGRILIADDHDALRRGLARALTSAGHEVEEAPNGNQAIERLHEGHFDVVLSDLKMGGSDGLDVLRTTKTLHPSTAVILMTAFGSRTRAIQIGGYGSFDGVMLGSFRRPRIEGTFTGERMRAWDVVWGSAQGKVLIENSYADVDGVVIRAGDSEIKTTGRFSLGYPRRDAGEVRDGVAQRDGLGGRGDPAWADHRGQAVDEREDRLERRAVSPDDHGRPERRDRHGPGREHRRRLLPAPEMRREVGVVVAEAAKNALGAENIYERIFIVEPLVEGGRVVGAVGFSVRESDVVVFEAEDRPGFLAKVLKRIGDEEINLTVTYTLTNTRIAIGSDQTARVKEIVQDFSRITA